MGRKKAPEPVTWATVRRLALALPGMEEGLCYGTPGLRVRGKFLERLKEDGETLVVKIGFLERNALMELEPKTFFTTDHYRGYPTVLVRLSSVGRERLRDILEQAWRRIAPKRLVAAYDAER
jgi:hypothetical protein